MSHKSLELNKRLATPLQGFASQTGSVNQVEAFFGCLMPRSTAQRAAQMAQCVPQRPQMPYGSIQRETPHFQQTAASTSRVVHR